MRDHVLHYNKLDAGSFPNHIIISDEVFQKLISKISNAVLTKDSTPSTYNDVYRDNKLHLVICNIEKERFVGMMDIDLKSILSFTQIGELDKIVDKIYSDYKNRIQQEELEFKRQKVKKLVDFVLT